MGSAQHIGRIGALAVALGLGAAVASTPAVALAAPETSSSSNTGRAAEGTEGSSSERDDRSDSPSSANEESTPPATDGDGDGDGDDDDDEDNSSDEPGRKDSSTRQDDAEPEDSAPDDAVEADAPGNNDDVTPVAEVETEVEPAPYVQPIETSSATRASASSTAVETDLTDTAVTTPDEQAADALTPLVAPEGDIPSPAELAVLAFTRREIGVSKALSTSATTSPPTAMYATTGQNPVDNWVREVEAFVTGAETWVRTYVSFEPWLNGSWLPPELRSVFFNSAPIAAPMQVEVDLDQGVTSGEIPFMAYDPDGNRIVYSVADAGMPGGPSHGTVVVDNATGTFTYTPDVDFTGTDTFSFVANDDTSIHFHSWENFVNAAFGLFGTSLDGGHRDTATVTIFNGLVIRPDPDVAEYTDINGDFSVLTYNMGGLPFPLPGGSWPRFASALEIGSLINGFDIVNVQEDVAYHPFLVANALFPDQTAPQVPTWLWPVGMPFSDGLNSFSAYDIEGLDREAWDGGAESLLNPKGFTYSRHHIPGGASIDIYNVSTSSGSMTDADIAQLSRFIELSSAGRAVIVTGDFDQRYSEAGQDLSLFASANGLTDAWVELEYNGIAPVDAPTCNYADSCEQPDKIFYRDAAPLDPGDPASSPVRLQALTYTNEGLNFLTADGRDLSDHRPQSVTFAYTVDAIGPMNVDLENWMVTLPALANLPLTQLPIPGTHDSGTYGITPTSEWALTGKADFGVLAELPGFLQDLVVKPIAAAWAKTQSYDLYQQFQAGIRYVDLRLSNEPDGTIYIEHGLRGPTIDGVIDDIARFANDHPKEMLVVYMQRFTNFTAETHEDVISKLETAIGPRMAPREIGTSATLQDLWDINKNVIVVYNNSAAVNKNAELWADNTLFRPWANVPSADLLLEANRKNLRDRPSGTIWGMFGEPTPNTTNIVLGILLLGPRSNQQFMWPLPADVQQWLRADFKDAVNLVTMDWFQTWPVGSSYSREVMAAAYETLGSRLLNAPATP